MEDVQRMRLRTAIRLRPTNEECVISLEKRILRLKDPAKGHSSEFVFDHSFPAEATQEEVFKQVGEPLVENVLQGYNACCFAYGQTGSGKTYSMIGKETGEWELRGLIPRAAEQLFQGARLKESEGLVRFSFYVSLMEIYQEHVRDLGKESRGMLSKSPEQSRSRPSSAKEVGWDLPKDSLEIQEDTTGKTFIKDLTYIEVSKAEDIVMVLKAGHSLRHTASTRQNDVSSRSHTVCTITVLQYPMDNASCQPKSGRLNMVDLAGSERLKKSHSSDVRLQEAKTINTSLTALGKVVMSLSLDGDRGHVPFRDSKLTRILKDSLNGSCYTTLLGNLNPTPGNCEECFNTLQFALRCSSISTVPQVNVVTAGTAQDKVIEQLTLRVAQLTEDMENVHSHYQKIIENLAGPNYTIDMGPLERGLSGQEASLARKTHQEEFDEVATVSAQPLSHENGTNGIGRSPRYGNYSKIEAERKALQQQIDVQKKINMELEIKLKRVKQEMQDVKKSLMRSEQNHRNDLRAAATRLKEAQEKHYEEVQAQRTIIEEQQNQFAAEKERLSGANETVRQQLHDVTLSVDEMASVRAETARKAEERGKEQQEEFESRYKMMADSISEQTTREMKISSLRSSQVLSMKDQELSNLRIQLTTLKDKCEHHVKNLVQEVDFLMSYATSLWSILNKIEKHEYPVSVINGLKAFKIPAKDKIDSPLTSPRVLKLKLCSEKAQEYVLQLKQQYEHCKEPRLHDHKEETSENLPCCGSLNSSRMASLDARQVNPDADFADTDPDAEEGETACKKEGFMSTEQDIRKSKEFKEVCKNLKRDLEVQVLADMQSHQTIQYIKSLESAANRYQDLAKQERKRNHDLIVALRSIQRKSVDRPITLGNADQKKYERPISAVLPPRHPAPSLHYLSSSRPSSAGNLVGLSHIQINRGPLPRRNKGSEVQI